MPAPARVLVFAPTYTASTWATLVQATGKAARNANGVATASDAASAEAPQLTGRDVLAIVDAWRRAASPVPGAFPLWYQYAAAAYGWEQAGDALIVDDAQASRPFAADYDVSLWLGLAEVARRLDDARVAEPTLHVVDVWGDPAVIADVHRALADDGVRAQLKVPLPFCRDPSTGKPTWPKPGQKCDPVTVDDPVTAILKRVGKPLLLAGVLFGVSQLFARAPRRPLFGGAARRRKKGRRHGNAPRPRRVLA